jgi:hypothetical protein
LVTDACALQKFSRKYEICKCHDKIETKSLKLVYFEMHKMKHVLWKPWPATYRSSLQCFIRISRVKEKGDQPKSAVNVCHMKKALRFSSRYT